MTEHHTCPTCGQPVQVVSSDEGTHAYVPAAQSALLRYLHDRERTIEHLAQGNYALNDELAAAKARAERAEAALLDVRRSLSRLRWWDLSLRGGCEQLLQRIDQALDAAREEATSDA